MVNDEGTLEDWHLVDDPIESEAILPMFGNKYELKRGDLDVLVSKQLRLEEKTLILNYSKSCACWKVAEIFRCG